mgnify:CR=1 FL=1
MEDTILKHISYFDIFSHPLKEEEICNLLGINSQSVEFYSVLNNLVKQNKCFIYDGYCSISKNVEELVQIRKVKEQKAQKYFKRLPSYVRLIKFFPFVKGLAVSGSLSKNIMHKDGDIDYFVITSPNRLWVCRTILIFFKKVFSFKESQGNGNKKENQKVKLKIQYTIIKKVKP